MPIPRKRDEASITNKSKSKKKCVAKYVPTKQTHSSLIESTDICTQPQLLLAYVYDLDDNGAVISIGYGASTLQPTINFSRHLESSIELTSVDWMQLFTKSHDINNFIANVDDVNNSNLLYIRDGHIIISVYRHVNQSNNNIVIILQNANDNSKQIKLSEIEWKRLNMLFEFLNTILNWFTLYAPNIKYYYDEYVKHCAIKNVYMLKTSDYFVIDDKSKVTFNQLRLFHELPIMCTTQLVYDVSLYKLYHSK